MYKLPSLSTDKALGLVNLASVASPPSPVLPLRPEPATVLMTPFEAIFLTTKLS